MIRSVLLLSLTIIFFGCRPNTQPGSQPTDDPSPTPHSSSVWYDGNTFVTLDTEGISIRLPVPMGWEHYETDYGVAIEEYMGSVATEGQLSGLLVHVFVPPLENFSVPDSSDQNLAWDILHEIIEDPAYLGGATASDPVGFMWNDQPAAYYLVDNDDSNPTLVLGVIVPGTRKMVACSISAPAEQIERIRHYLPVLLNGLSINAMTFAGAELEAMPDPFHFPEHEKSGHAEGS